MNINQLTAMLQSYLKEMAKGKVCIGYEQLGYDASGAFALADIPDGATSAEITFEDAGAADSTLVCRYRIDGTDPTTSVGVPAGKADTIEISNNTNILKFRVIAVDAVTQVLNVLYYA